MNWHLDCWLVKSRAAKAYSLFYNILSNSSYYNLSECFWDIYNKVNREQFFVRGSIMLWLNLVSGYFYSSFSYRLPSIFSYKNISVYMVLLILCYERFIVKLWWITIWSGGEHLLYPKLASIGRLTRRINDLSCER